jgi:hypothetical protein
MVEIVRISREIDHREDTTEQVFKSSVGQHDIDYLTHIQIRAGTALVNAVCVMDGLGTIEGNTEANIQLAEKVEPFGRDKGAICLERVCGDNVAAKDSGRLGYKTTEECLAG